MLYPKGSIDNKNTPWLTLAPQHVDHAAMTVRDAVARTVGSRWLKGLTAALLAAIAVLSLVPKNIGGVDDGVIHGSPQHFSAYFVTAAVAGLATARRRNPVGVFLALAAFAGLMEVLQTFSPGRVPELEGFVASGLGAAAGALVAFAARAP